MSEQEVVEELLKIHNLAILRCQTCSKFSLDRHTEEELQEKIMQMSDEIKQQQFEQNIQACLDQSSKAGKSRLERIFKRFDKRAQEGFDVQDLISMDDL